VLHANAMERKGSGSSSHRPLSFWPVMWCCPLFRNSITQSIPYDHGISGCDGGSGERRSAGLITWSKLPHPGVPGLSLNYGLDGKGGNLPNQKTIFQTGML